MLYWKTVNVMLVFHKRQWSPLGQTVNTQFIFAYEVVKECFQIHCKSF